MTFHGQAPLKFATKLHSSLRQHKDKKAPLSQGFQKTQSETYVSGRETYELYNSKRFWLRLAGHVVQHAVHEFGLFSLWEERLSNLHKLDNHHFWRRIHLG